MKRTGCSNSNRIIISSSTIAGKPINTSNRKRSGRTITINDTSYRTAATITHAIE